MDTPRSRLPWVPSLRVAFRALVAVRVLGVVLNYITDCDETFNYWEPTHYLIYGFGQETWEYSPEFALRSYFYILPQAAVGRVLAVFLDKPVVFTILRVMLAAQCVASECYLYRGIAFVFHRSRIPQLALAFLLCTTGMFTASTAFLPSSFAMCLIAVAVGAYLDRKPGWAVFAVGVAALVGWPFCALAAAPLALALLVQHGLLRVVRWGVISLIAIVAPMMLVDSYYYGKPVMAALNLAIYNVLAPSGGSELYGVESWTFYFRNGTLNFNFVLWLSLLAPALPLLLRRAFDRTIGPMQRTPYWVATTPVWLWIGFMSLQPHKEERFLSVVFPLICVGGAASAALLATAAEDLLARGKHVVTEKKKEEATMAELRAPQRGAAEHPSSSIGVTLLKILVLIVLLLSVSRTYSLVHGYGAPMTLWRGLYEDELRGGRAGPPDEQVNVCVGKEWYRFSSSFFLPNKRYRLQYVRSGFTGQLPQAYSESADGTRVTLPHFNGGNREEPSRYVDESVCHYMIDRDDPDQAEPRYYGQGPWKTVIDLKFLDAARSPLLARVLFIPMFSQERSHYNHYVLLRNSRLVRR